MRLKYRKFGITERLWIKWKNECYKNCEQNYFHKAKITYHGFIRRKCKTIEEVRDVTSGTFFPGFHRIDIYRATRCLSEVDVIVDFEATDLCRPAALFPSNLNLKVFLKLGY